MSDCLTLAGCPIIQSTVLSAQFSKTAHLQHQSQVPGPQATGTTVQLHCKVTDPHNLHFSGLTIFARMTLKTEGDATYVYQFLIKDTTHRARNAGQGAAELWCLFETCHPPRTSMWSQPKRSQTCHLGGDIAMIDEIIGYW